MKQKIKRILSGFLAVLTLFTTLFSNGNFVYAASAEAHISLWNGSVKSHEKISEFSRQYSGDILYSMIDGHSAYCMNHGLSAKNSQLMTSDTNPKTQLSADERKLLAYCMYFGYSSTENKAPTNEQRDQYIATQAMVWIITEGVFGTDKADSAASKLCAVAPNSGNSYAYYATLRDNITKSFNATRPSFAAKSSGEAPTYVLKWNESNKRYEYTLKDTNGVAGTFDITLDGYKVEKNGNSVTISTTGVNTNTTTARMKSTAGIVETTSSSIFWLTGNDEDQEFVSEQPQADPISAYFKVKTESVGYGDLTKTDASTGAKVKGAVYGIYSDKACKNKVTSMTTDGNGYAKSKALTPGTYYVKEISVPKPYILDTKTYTLSVTAGKTTGIKVTDKEQKAKLTIYKQGEVLSGWNGKNFTYETRKLKGATFKVTAGEDIFKADGTRVYKKGDVVASGLTTTGEAGVTVSNLYLGTYIVKETGAPNGYKLNTAEKTVSLTYGGQSVEIVTKSVTVTDTRQKANVSVTKQDSSTKNPLSGGKYTIYAGSDIKNIDGKVIVTKGTALQTVTTGTDGKGTYTVDLPINKSYYITETKAPAGYVRSDEKYTFTFNYLSNTVASASFTHVFKNDRVKAKISLYKVDEKTGKAAAQGDGTLKGAVYGLYAREDIVHPDGKKGVIYKKDALIKKLTTDEKGQASVSDLYLGKYYVKEITPSEGYVLDKQEHDVVCSYKDDKTAEIAQKVTSKETPITQPFQLIKVALKGSDTEADVLEGAGFTAYLKSSLKVKKDGSYDFKNSTPVVITEDGKTTMYTDKTGYACSVALPYGTYVVIESVTPKDMETIKPFEVNIKKNSPTTPQVWRVFLDKEFSAKLRIVKKDSTTGRTVLKPDATFRIYNRDTKKYVTMITTYPSKVKHDKFSTDGDGDLILPEKLPVGNYRIEEVNAPDGYILNKNYADISISSKSAYEVDADTYEAIIEVDYPDTPAYGELNIVKQGEILDGFDGSLMKDKSGNFVYKTGNLAGAKFKIYAAEDIYTQDNQKDESGERYKIYSKGQFVKEVTTNAQGKAAVSNLPLGNYRIIEVQAPYGYVLNGNEQIVNLRYVDDKTPVVKETATFKNERQKISLSVIKKDSETDKPVSGAQFSLYAAEDIKNNVGKVIVKAGTKLETAESDVNGNVVFSKDYPFAKYEIRETKAPKGYVSNNMVIVFDAKYQGQNQGTVKYQSECRNTPTTFEFSKQDITSSAEIAGAKLEVTDKNGNVIDSWTSAAGEKHVIKYLVAGETYTLKETLAPYGYLRAAEISFTVKDTDKIQSVTMKDETAKGTIIINKEGEFLEGKSFLDEITKNLKFSYIRKNLAGVTFNVYAAEDIVSVDGLNTIYHKKDELVGTIVTDKAGIGIMGNLPLGNYYLVETKTIEGFVLDSTPKPAALIYKDDVTPVVFAKDTYNNERQKISITLIKKDSENLQPLAGGVFALYSKEDIKDSEGNAVVFADEKVEEAVSDENGNVLFNADLPLGKYYVKEILPPKGYATNTEIIEIDASYKGQDVKVIEYVKEVTDNPTQVEVSKIDITSEAEIAGATLSVSDKSGNVIETWESVAGESHLIKHLVAGETYILREEFAPYGYLVANDIEFTVEDTGEVQKVVMKDEVPVGTIVINKDGEFVSRRDLVKGRLENMVFGFTKKSLKGVTFEVFAAEDVVSPDGLNTVFYEKDEHVGTIVTEDSGIGIMENLPLGRYYLVESKTIEGFVLDSTPIQADLSYVDQNTPYVYAGMSVTNERQKVSIKVIKLDAETERPLADGVFGLFAAEDITDTEGNVIVSKDEKIETAVSGEDGYAVFNTDLPLGNYYVKEINPPAGYVTNKEVINVDATYQGQDVKVIEYTHVVKDNPTEVEFSKIDITSEKEIPGASLTVLDTKGNVIDKWVSKKNKTHKIKHLVAGETYILREETAPDGYVRAQDVKFTVMDDDTIQKVTMKDDYTKVDISKTDITGEKELGGATLAVIDSEGKLVDSWKSIAGKSHRIEYLKVGKYTLVEETAPYGYKIAKEIQFEVKETGAVQKVTMKDEQAVGRIIINKTDSESGEPLAGVHFEIRDKDGKVIETLVTDVNGKAQSKEMPVCTYNKDGSFKENIHYYVVETKTIEGYVLDETVHDVELTYEGNAPECVEYTLDVTNDTEPEIPQTGDDFNPGLFVGLGASALIAGVAMMKGRKKKEDEEETVNQ